MTLRKSELDGGSFRAVRTCYDRLIDAVGGGKTFRLSAYRLYSFFPTRGERARGARWMRCDAVLIEGRRSIQQLPVGDLTPGGLPLSDQFARCLTRAKGNFFLVACSKPHQYRAVKAIKVPGAFPANGDKFERIARRGCPKVAGRNGLANYPFETEYAAGGRYVVCSRKTRN